MPMRLRLVLILLLLTPAPVRPEPVVEIGSKRFTESYILGEILARSAGRAGEARARHRPGLGNTAIVFAALREGAIDLYPDYTGTVALELLGLASVPPLEELDRKLAPLGLGVAIPLGFSNAYALAMSRSRARQLGISRISDLARHPGLRYVFSHEFLTRKDGWPGVRTAYGLAAEQVAGLDHALAYAALSAGEADVTDAYTTDPRVDLHDLQLLEDDRGFFPAYEAIVLHRRDLRRRLPATWRALETLEGRITRTMMVAMNADAELRGADFGRIAQDFLAARYRGDASSTEARRPGLGGRVFAPDFWRLTLEHLALVFGSLALAVTAGVPMGVLAHRRQRARAWIMGAAGVLQTVPALALLAFLVAALDRIGTLPAVAALLLYSLLPIVRNTEAGLSGVPPTLRQAAAALGLRPWHRLRLIELPLAGRTLVAGIKTAAVINVGTATIAAFIGAGGYGERIVAGLAVNDHELLLAGAIPAAALALLIQGIFDAAERRLAPWERT